jgi:hypothetical protein
VRVRRSTTRYPAYDHTSFNLEHVGPRVTARASLHVKYAWTNGGFWFGLRPEVEVHRATDAHRAMLKKMRGAEIKETCRGCGREELLPFIGDKRGWHQVSSMSVACPECFETKPMAELWP